MLGVLTACGGGGSDPPIVDGGGGGGGGGVDPPVVPTELHPPSAPTLLQALGGDTQVTLSWAAATGATSYNLYWADSVGITTLTGSRIADVVSPYVHTGLTNGSTYYYVVTAVNADGESAPSSVASVTLAPSAPGTVSAVSGDHQVTVDWRDVMAATTYNLYWSNLPGVTKTTGTKIPSAIAPYVLVGLTNGTTYYYVVTAVGAGGESVESAQVSAVPQVPVPTAPQNLSAILTAETTKSVTLQWSKPDLPADPADILSYNLYRSTTPGVAANLPTATKTAGVASPHIDLVPAGQVTYYYVVTAVTAGGEGPASAEVSATPRGSPGTGGGGGETGAFGNNLSVPLVFADGVGILGGAITGTDHTDLATGLRPTATDETDPFPFLSPATVYKFADVDYYKQQTESTWQASWINGKSAMQDVELDWGDNLVSASLSVNQVIRVETVLRQYKGNLNGTSWDGAESMSGYPMQLLYGQGDGEMQGTTGVAADAIERRVFAVNARLQIQKLDAGGVPVVPDHACNFNGSIAEGLAMADGGALTKYSAEINVGGSQTYGFNWRLNQCTAADKAGTYRITFSLDDQATVGGTPHDNNTRIQSLHSSEAAAVRVDEKSSYIDVTVN